MSYCEIYAVKANGNIEFYDEAKNAWGGAIHIWDSLSKKYGVSCGLMQYDPLWKMVGGSVMTEMDQLILGSTFDRVIIKKERMSALISALEGFVKEFPSATLEKEIEILKGMLEDADVIGVCFNQTSVGEMLLQGKYDEATDEQEPYNIFTTDEHWFLSVKDGKAIDEAELQGA